MNAIRFGKHPPKVDYRTLRFKSYVTPELAPPPARFDVLSQVYKKLHEDDAAALFPMDGNDTLGDCTIAALAHAVTAFSGLIGERHIMTKTSVVKVYLHLTGGIDSGLAELDVLNYWRKTRVDGEKILAYATLDPHNHENVKQAIHLFGGVYLGFRVQKGCVEDFHAHRTWHPAALTRDGHAVFATAYDADTLTVLTWGSTQRASWAWWDECVDEAYALLPPQAKTAGFAPGFDFKQLEADLREVTD